MTAPVGGGVNAGGGVVYGMEGLLEKRSQELKQLR